MKKYPSYKMWIGAIILLLILSIHLYHAITYYDLAGRKLTPFFIWQANSK
jgi:hypothetical protein